MSSFGHDLNSICGVVDQNMLSGVQIEFKVVPYFCCITHTLFLKRDRFPYPKNRKRIEAQRSKKGETK